MLTIRDYINGLKNGNIIGTKCKKCGNITIPLKPVCPKCGSFDMEEFETAGKGVLRSFTVIYVAPPKFVSIAPYVVGIIKLDEGPSLMGRIVGVDPNKPEEIKVGTKVKFEPLVENGKVVVAFRPV
ncbi:MAG: hypothetical protein GWP10_14605 [Nitrospiraceae bacterium]|nr:hypothetical protein [Nitrospiraceae bacterium]